MMGMLFVVDGSDGDAGGRWRVMVVMMMMAMGVMIVILYDTLGQTSTRGSDGTT